MKRAITIMALALFATQLYAGNEATQSGRIVQVAETEHFIFWAARKGDHTLQVDAERSEHTLRDLSLELGVTVPGKTTYVRLEYPEEVAFLSGEPSRWSSGVANARAQTIHSVLPCHPHEIVHIVAAQLGEPGTFFSEGLAVALGDKGRMQGRDVDDLARRYLHEVSAQRVMVEFQAVDALAAYSIAGSFMRHLLREHGTQQVVRFFRSAGHGQTREAFQATFGVALDAAMAEWQASL